ncbi:MAG: tetratricopeptide repeat protein [Bacteroidota bacterium]|jgi:Ca-activated chloride channel family protein
MRPIVTLLIAFLSLSVIGQQWRDSLETARNLYRKGEYEKALKYYESAQKNAPNGIDLSDEMGQSAYKLRDFERAEKIYRQSASSKKDNGSKARSYHNLGNACMKKKDYQSAADAYRQALRNDPENERTRYNLSEAIRRMKQEEKDQKEKDKNNKEQNNDQQNSGDQSQNKQEDQQGNQRRNKEQSGKDNRPNNKRKNGQNRSSLPNRSVDRMLDELMKAESATKRKMGGNQGEGPVATSGKDW